MNLKSLIVSAVLSLSTSAYAQWYGGGCVGVGFGGGYSSTVVSSNYGSASVVTTNFGGGVGYYGGYYGGGYYGGCVTPRVLPYYGYTPAYVPYQSYNYCYPTPYYRPVVVAPVVYGGYGGCGQYWVR